MTGAVRLFNARLVREDAQGGFDPFASTPMSLDNEDETNAEGAQVERETADYQQKDEGFIIGDRVYNRQVSPPQPTLTHTHTHSPSPSLSPLSTQLGWFWFLMVAHLPLSFSLGGVVSMRTCISTV